MLPSIEVMSGILGLVIGSFLNVVIVRLPKDQSLIRPGSACPRCGRSLKWYENIPVLSFLMQMGRCRGCKASISLRYPLVEALTGVVFFVVAREVGEQPLVLVRDLVLIAGLIAVVFIDLEHRIIPDPISIGGAVFALLTAPFVPLGAVQAFLGAALGFGTFLAFAWIYQKITGRMGLGGGDIKLMAYLGGFLGAQSLLTTILVSSLTGSLIGIGYAVFRREKDVMQLAVPFGPFLVAGAMGYYFFGDFLARFVFF